MREIKFKAWVNINGFKFIANVINMTDLTGDKFIDVQKEKSFYYDVDKYELMQYTGLKDKDGKEIYEGDIVKTFNGDIGYIEHGFHQNQDILDRCEDFYNDGEDEGRMEYGYYVRHVDSCHSLDNKTYSWIQVIGDIHSNPELLEA